MTNEEIIVKLRSEFSAEECEPLGFRPVSSVPNMVRGDKVIVEDSLLDYLRDFFNEIYDGEPIPKVFESCLIEWRTPNGTIKLFVSFPKDHEEWVYIDIFYEWKFLGKMLFPNVKLDDVDRNEDGKFFTYAPFFTKEKLQQQLLTQMLPAVKDVFTYTYLYVQANKETKSVYKEETVPAENTGKQSKKKSGKKSSAAKRQQRDVVYVPRRRIYTIRKTEETERSLREYVYSRWKVRGYSYVRKDGRRVNVKEHYAFRHLPNKGVDKDGKDFILRKKPEDAN